MALLFKVGNKKDLPKAPDRWPTCGSYVKKEIEDFFDLNCSLRIFINQFFVISLSSFIFAFNF
jgi:hypothetical protein